MRWRQRVRHWLSILVVLTVLAAVLGLAWISRQPEHALFETLSTVPMVGALVDEVREPYLRQTQMPSASVGSDSENVKTADRTATTEWIGIGAQLYSEASRTSSRRSKTVRLAQYSVLQREDPWLEVLLPDGSTAWIDRSEPRDVTPPLGEAPRPPGPLNARPASPDRLAEALMQLQEPRELELNGYIAWTDLPESAATDALFASARKALAPLEARYEELYGLSPRGEPRETIVLFRTVESYRALQSQTSGIEGVLSAGHTSGGMIALAVDAREMWEVEATLVHEVCHLLNRRAIGPGLPPWLAEGLADHLAQLARTPSPELDDRFRLVEEQSISYRGPLAALRLLAARAEEGTLLALAALTQSEGAAFLDGTTAPLLYAQSAFFIDWLLDEPELQTGFRSFLAAIAEGGSVSSDALLAQLNRSWTDLDQQFGRWLVSRRDRALLAGR